MKNKEFDAIKMIRDIRDKSSRDYYANKNKWLKKLAEFQGSEIKTSDNKPVKKAQAGRKASMTKSKSKAS